MQLNKELEKRIDEILYFVWDPIGVSDEPAARTEYSGYVLGVLRMVTDNDEIKPISEFLAKIANDKMGLIPDTAHCDYVAELLLRCKKSICV